VLTTGWLWGRLQSIADNGKVLSDGLGLISNEDWCLVEESDCWAGQAGVGSANGKGLRCPNALALLMNASIAGQVYNANAGF
jgi:hypothetical protein